MLKSCHKLDVHVTFRTYIKHTQRRRKAESLFISSWANVLGIWVIAFSFSRWVKECTTLTYSAKQQSATQGYYCPLGQRNISPVIKGSPVRHGWVIWSEASTLVKNYRKTSLNLQRQPVILQDFLNLFLTPRVLLFWLALSSGAWEWHFGQDLWGHQRRTWQPQQCKVLIWVFIFTQEMFML